MTSEIDNGTCSQGNDIMDSDIKKSLAIFNTDIDRYGNDSFGKEPNFERFLRIMHREQNTTHKMKFFVS